MYKWLSHLPMAFGVGASIECTAKLRSGVRDARPYSEPARIRVNGCYSDRIEQPRMKLLSKSRATSQTAVVEKDVDFTWKGRDEYSDLGDRCLRKIH